MIYIFISVVAFILATVIHLFVHRFFVLLGHKTFKSVAVYGFGLISLLLIFSSKVSDNLFPALTDTWLRVPLPLAGIVLYSLFSILYIMLFTSPYTGDVSPSIQLFLLIKRIPGINHQAILHEFSEKELIGHRLHNLVRTRYIQKLDNRYYVSKKGQTVIRLIESYRHWLRWTSSG